MGGKNNNLREIAEEDLPRLTSPVPKKEKLWIPQGGYGTVQWSNNSGIGISSGRGRGKGSRISA